MRHVSWSKCLETVRFLANLLTKPELGREKWIIRSSCECLDRFPFPARPMPQPEEVGASSWTMQSYGSEQASDKAEPGAREFVPPDAEAYEGENRQERSKGKKGKGK